MDKENIEVHSRSGIHNPKELLSPVAPHLPEAVRNTVNHEIAHANADPGKNSKGGEFGYSAVLVKLPNGLVMASWIAWYQPWGEREPEDMMEMAKAPGWGKMSNQDLFVYQQAKSEWFVRLKEKQNDADEKNPVSILEIVPSKEGETEDEYDRRRRFVFEFARKLDEAIVDGFLPPEDELIEFEFMEIHEKYQEVFMRAYNDAKKEIENSTSGVPEEVADKKEISEEEKVGGIIEDRIKESTGGVI